MAAQLALICAGSFFLVGLLTGIWKYAQIAKSDRGRAHYYVDIAHRASLMYAFACLILERFARLSVFSAEINTAAVAAAVLFFALAVVSYVIHGWLQDTRNQMKRPHKLGSVSLPNVVMVAFMALLIVAEVGGFLTLFIGYLKGL